MKHFLKSIAVLWFKSKGASFTRATSSISCTFLGNLRIGVDKKAIIISLVLCCCFYTVVAPIRTVMISDGGLKNLKYRKRILDGKIRSLQSQLSLFSCS